MKNVLKKFACIILVLAIAVAYAPLGLVWAVDGVPGEDTAEGAENASSVIINEEVKEESDDNEDTGSTDEALNNNDEENDDTLEEAGSEKTVNTRALSSPEAMGENIVTVDPDIENGTVSMEGMQGTATPAEGYDLATVRQIWAEEDGTQHEQYLEFTENNGIYTFEADPEKQDSEITAFFFSLTKWDGAVDVTWYDPDQTEFEISTPAQLAGLAAITNGMVDNFVTDNNKVTTEEYMIKDNEGRDISDGVYTHKYISTEDWLVDLLAPNSSGGSGDPASQVRDTAWRLPEVKHKKIAEDDVHNDFLYRTVKLTADLDMSGANWTPIGGKYAMNRDAKTGSEAKVIDTRFQGILDGQGHTVKLDCNRQAKMGFPYAMEIGFVGYLGGGVDYENGYPKDTCMDYKKYWVPTVRNVIVTGEVKGRRMVGGVVGRIGETNYGVVVENCANYADVEATDMRGCAGIVGAAWGKSIIRNCYNAGSVISGFWEHGGIVGSNGYEGTGNRVAKGANIYNCYNIGASLLNIGGGQIRYDGQEIGVDGNSGASYEIANCYYLKPENEIEKQTGYNTGTNKKIKIQNVESCEAAYMKTGEFIKTLNMNGEIFVPDENNINDGYPILYFQAALHSGYAQITLDKSGSENGSIAFVNSSADTLTNVPNGSIVDFSVNANAGYRLSEYVVTCEGSEVFEIKSGNFFAVTGKDITVRALFEEVSPTKIIFNEPEDEGELYYVVVKNVGRMEDDGFVRYDSPIDVSSGEMLGYRECISITGVMKDWGDRQPDNNSTEYTGKLSDPYEDDSLSKVSGTNNVYEIKGVNDTAFIQFKPKTQGKRWTSVADTDWYVDGEKTFTIRTAKELAGLAKLCGEKESFEGVTILLGNDISLENTVDNSGDIYGYERSWMGIGVNDRYSFKGTFDGQGHTIKYMHRNFAPGYSFDSGSLGGLFGYTDGAVIRNVKVVGGSYVNDDGVTMQCGFINGAAGGGIVGTAVNTLIENCSTDIPMSGGKGTNGGIAGEISGSTIVRNCTSNCNISSEGWSVGGIVATIIAYNTIEDEDHTTGDTTCSIENCSSNGNITSKLGKVGGILGSGESFAVDVSKCVNNGSISTYMNGTSTIYSMGGIVGYSTGSLTVSECINNGALYGYDLTNAVSGIAGYITKGKIAESINLGDIYSESTSESARVSGIASLGTGNANKSKIINSYNAGKIVLGEGFSEDAKKNVGGVSGYGSNVTNEFSNAICTSESVSACGGKAGIAGKVVSADQLKNDPASLLGDSFVPDINNVNGGFPVLTWQDPEAAEAARKAKQPAAPAEPLLPAMKIKSAKNSKSKAAVIKWNRVKDAAGYQIMRSMAKDGNYKVVKTVKVTKKLKKKKTLDFTNKKLKKKKTYYYKIRYYKKVNGKTVYSELSAPKAVKVKK